MVFPEVNLHTLQSSTFFHNQSNSTSIAIKLFEFRALDGVTF